MPGTKATTTNRCGTPSVQRASGHSSDTGCSPSMTTPTTNDWTANSMGNAGWPSPPFRPSSAATGRCHAEHLVPPISRTDPHRRCLQLRTSHQGVITTPSMDSTKQTKHFQQVWRTHSSNSGQAHWLSRVGVKSDLGTPLFQQTCCCSTVGIYTSHLRCVF